MLIYLSVEILEKFIINPLKTAKDSVILLDEPESALSITNQFKLIDAIKTAIHCNSLNKWKVVNLLK